MRDSSERNNVKQKMRCLSQKISKNDVAIDAKLWVFLQIWVQSVTVTFYQWSLPHISKRVFQRTSQHWYPTFVAFIPVTSQHQALPAISAYDHGPVPGTAASNVGWMSCSSRTHGMLLEYRVRAFSPGIQEHVVNLKMVQQFMQRSFGWW